MGKTVVVGVRFTIDDLNRLNKALAGSLKGAYSNHSEFIRAVVLAALDQIEERS